MNNIGAEPDSMGINRLGGVIIEGACNSEAKDLASDLSEIALDSFLEEGVLKEIPLSRSIIACRKTWETINDQLFLRKVVGFMFACSKFTEAERDAFRKENLNDAKKAKHLADTLILILEKLDDLEKPAIVAKAFSALVRRKIRLETFRRLAAAIDIAFIEDLKALTKYQAKQDEGLDDYIHNLVRSGLTQLYGPRENVRESKGQPLR